MQNKHLVFPVLCLGLALNACVSNDLQTTARDLLGQYTAGSSNVAGLSATQIAAGLKEALSIGTQTVVAQVGRQGGYNLDPQIRIPLPASLAKADTALKAIGLGVLTQDLQTRMNSAAEMAAAEGKILFLDAIKQMTIGDARKILSGQQDAATQYLRGTMGAALTDRMKPIIADTMAQAGAIQAYDKVTGQYAALPFVSGIKADLNEYVANKAVDGIFHYVAQEEAAIRQNPAKRTTELLRAVFGSQ